MAKLDRLSRDAAFTLHIRNSGVDFTCADNPDVNRHAIGLLAVINEAERECISERTKATLAAIKAGGVKLSNPYGAKALRLARKGNRASVAAIQNNADRFAEGLRDTVVSIRREGLTSLAGIASELSARLMKTARQQLACLFYSEPCEAARLRLLSLCVHCQRPRFFQLMTTF